MIERSIIAVLGLAALVWTGAAQAAVDRPRVEAGFRIWLETEVRPAARKAGVSAETFDGAMAGIELDWTLPDLAPPGAPPLEGPQRQAEFADPGRYVAEQNFAALTKEGQAELKAHARTLDAVERRFGVPREIVVAIWGRESRYGRAKIPHVAIRALATEAYIGARKERFFPELVAALRILEGDHVPLAEMKSSWAGAMGQPQFLPSKYLENAVDMDGDGKRDIWGSVPDVLGSIANYMRKHGWTPGRPWGVEIELPAEIACTIEGPDQQKPAADWSRQGVRRIGGDALPRLDAAMNLMAPAGRTGPTFLVTNNFYAIKEYNESDLYALFVGHLADRLKGGGPIQGKWTTPKGVARADIAAMQRRLEATGHDVGTADGLVGFRTRVAVGRWEAKQGRRPTCFPDPSDVKQIGR
ncbi:lytic murein transglycosylase [Hansschlegelia zhihuaiae]|uniref:Lytic murein transglycosylase n=1 Tax=Hansschlegelia zhihuaiae TaxID=405005 RepID=A0A4Q0MKI2_9HYPH|nr:lytic murein transglycosylase [Hansschlegelia zhihuaiae]RXF73995.1 lytic murein transglycosylase [Hansschlegelia zhihuaiae]